MKLITAHRLNRFWKNGVLPIKNKVFNVLSTKDDIMANTVSGHLVDALAVKEIANELNTGFTSVSEGKKAVATALTNQGVSTSATATFATIASNVSKVGTNKYNAGYSAGYNAGKTASTPTFAGKPIKTAQSTRTGHTSTSTSFTISDSKKYLIIAIGEEVNLNQFYDSLTVTLKSGSTVVGTVANSPLLEASSNHANEGCARRKSMYYITNGNNQTLTLTVSASTHDSYEQIVCAEILAFRLG